MNIKKKLILIMLCMLIPTACFATEQYDFANAFIDGLQQLVINRDRSENIDVNQEGTQMTVDLMTENRLAIDNIIEAKNGLQKYISSKNMLIAETAKNTSLAYDIFIANGQTTLHHLEQLAKGQGIGDFDIGKQGANIRRAWDMMLKCSILMTHCLIDEKPDENGKKSYMEITSKERAELKEKLVSLFGEDVKGGLKGGQTKLQACGASIYKVLDDPFKSADERPK